MELKTRKEYSDAIIKSFELDRSAFYCGGTDHFQNALALRAEANRKFSTFEQLHDLNLNQYLSRPIETPMVKEVSHG